MRVFGLKSMQAVWNVSFTIALQSDPRFVEPKPIELQPGHLLQMLWIAFAVDGHLRCCVFDI
ncbi:hypothetical protein Pan97_17610 [Bremerella volcania]|uniref:Uncharacterized protein n=1 Tax=Bremerella volcania TaxID=2527984 RepID=A0A518C6A1_9BACT|nr:hypothetical protein Pan97_17610 [Bremerella volcania]